MEEQISVKDFLKINFVEDYLIHDNEGKPHSPLSQLLQDFAKIHVKAALDKASKEAKLIKYTDNFGDPDKYLDKNSIINAYPLTNIK